MRRLAIAALTLSLLASLGGLAYADDDPATPAAGATEADNAPLEAADPSVAPPATTDPSTDEAQGPLQPMSVAPQPTTTGVTFSAPEYLPDGSERVRTTDSRAPVCTTHDEDGRTLTECAQPVAADTSGTSA